MWRERISALFDDARLAPPATEQQIRQIERELNVVLPPELKALLLESDGIAAYYGSPLVWPAAEIIEQNRLFRTNPDFVQLYMPFDGLLFFGAEGNGDQFAYRILGGQIRETSWIYEWDHESDNRTWFASDLNEYFRRCRSSDE
jgi:SMI1-KNR4 cell-wall